MLEAIEKMGAEGVAARRRASTAAATRLISIKDEHARLLEERQQADAACQEAKVCGGIRIVGTSPRFSGHFSATNGGFYFGVEFACQDALSLHSMVILHSTIMFPTCSNLKQHPRTFHL